MILLVLTFLIPFATPFTEPTYDLIIVRNDNLIDYITVLPYSYLIKAPILPVNPDGLDPITKAQLYSYVQLRRTNVLIVGNAQAISLEIERELENMGFTVTRIGGVDRTETAEKLAVHFYPQGSETVVLASALDYGSTLAAAKLAMEYRLPLLLTWEDRLSPSALRGLEELNARMVILVGFGLNKTIEDTLRNLGYTTYWIGENIAPPPIETPKPPEENPYKYTFIGAIGALLVAVPIVLYLARRKWGSSKVPLEILSEKEIAVIRAIVENGGTIKQEDLPELVGYSRPTVSRIIQELERKGLVEREKVGKTFIVRLVKEVDLKGS
nr:cell wall-binding repeat-containing protein [Pyrococcus yayanosii]